MTKVNKAKMLAKMRENAAILVLLRHTCDDAYCACGEPWETGRAAVNDLTGSVLLSFQYGEGRNEYGFHLFKKCPSCAPVEGKIAQVADEIWDEFMADKKLPAEDEPDEYLLMI